MDKLPVDYATCECLRLGTDDVTVLMSSAQSGGALFAIELRMPPGGGPPVMHRHEPAEVYFVQRGEFTVYTGELGPDGGWTAVQRVTAGPGDVVPLAGGVPHTFRNESDAEAVAFCVHAPGTAFEGFVRAGAALAAQGEPSMDQVLDIAARNGIELLGPIPATVAAGSGSSAAGLAERGPR
ncbi:cupin domain-containing protein [Pseudonocardia broussonetiae]|uniref:Cupin domain-containing protein n=1 Tax=Pseudonocardia broussonetiae TaxID=2736640 RepID=A0A6M6JGK0_9PSEU|nr:cupin domain-containing protein [Pseudonocardia broussonetiae]QJY45509.1 cupin domain-containing protein [Pseudonocardia broussonetiae]